MIEKVSELIRIIKDFLLKLKVFTFNFFYFNVHISHLKQARKNISTLTIFLKTIPIRNFRNTFTIVLCEIKFPGSYFDFEGLHPSLSV